jgi:hypothetical protein
MDKNVAALTLVAILVVAFVAVYFAKKGHHVKIGTPLLNAEIN